MELRFPVLLDGAMGTAAQVRGYTGEISTEQWLLEHPAVLAEIQQSYVAAGSRIVYAPTFGANRQKLEERGIFNQTEEYNARLVGLSRSALGNSAWIAGDIAPTGLFLSPMGTASFEELVDIYTEQAAGLASAGVDLFVIETMMTLPDARAAVLAVRSVSDKPILVSFTCDENGRSLSGTDVTAALTVLQGMGVDAFGLNCLSDIGTMVVQLQRLREFARVPLMAKPNAGLPDMSEGKAVYNFPPEKFASYVPEMLAAGVGFFGGCCGTDATHLAALNQALEGAEFVPPVPMHTDELTAVTEKQVFCLPVDADHGPVLRCSDTLEEDLTDAMEDGFPMVAVAVDSWEDVDALADVQYLFSKPLCLVCDSADLLEAALRVYQGRALYEGGLSEEELLPLVNRYGLLI